MKRYIAVFTLAWVSQVAFAADGIGLVRVCQLQPAPRPINSGGVFYQSPNGTDDGHLSIAISNAARDPAHPGCSIGSATISQNPGNEALPAQGFKWHQVVSVDSFKSVRDDNGMQHDERVVEKIPLEAELISNFIAAKGKIKICRRAGITGMMDGKEIDVPADTYTGSCDKNGDSCRNIIIKGSAATIGKAKSACVMVDAELVETDGKPIRKGEELLPQWSVAGFTPKIITVTAFK